MSETLQDTEQVCRRCDHPFHAHRSIQKFCPMYCTFQDPSPLREPSETPEAIEPEREALEEVIAIAQGQGQTTAEIAAFILAAGFRRSALPVETPTDTERLDWLEAKTREGMLPNFTICGSDIHLDFGTHDDDREEISNGSSLREAIDAARLSPPDPERTNG